MLPIDRFQTQMARQRELDAVRIAPAAGNSGEASRLGRPAPALSVDCDASPRCPGGDSQAEREFLRLRRGDPHRHRIFERILTALLQRATYCPLIPAHA